MPEAAQGLKRLTHMLGRARRQRWVLPQIASASASASVPAVASSSPTIVALPFSRGRTIFGRGSKHRYIDAAEFPVAADLAANTDMYGWIDPSQWRHWPDLAGRRVAIVANRSLTGQGADIDAYDDVIRLNRIPFWAHDAEHDGLRMTIWAGVAAAQVVPRFNERFRAVAMYPSCFPEVAGQLRAIWCVSPFHISARFLNFVTTAGLRDRLVVSGGAAFYYDTILASLPTELTRLLYTLPSRDDHPMPQLHIDLMLIGVKTALLCLLGGAAEIALFGFTFYAEGTRQPWEGHDMSVDKEILEAMERHAPSVGCTIRRF